MGLFDLDIDIKDIVKTVADFIPNENERHKAQAQLEIKLKKFQHEIQVQQIETNKIEAAHPSLFKGGYRAFAGWVCGVGLAYGTILQPFLDWIAVVCFGYSGALPEVDLFVLMNLLVGMLGLGRYRHKEKFAGVEGK